MEIITLTSLKNIDKFLSFCKEAYTETDKLASENMWDDNWESKPHTLPYIIFYTNRFKYPNGEFHIAVDNNNIIGCSGIYRSDFCKDIGIAGCRTWIDKKYRNKSVAREFLLPADKKWAVDNDIKIICLTFNNYNKNLIEIWKRYRLGENRTTRKPYHLFYNNFNELTYPVNIQYTSQWIIYEKLDNNFNYDWEKIL